MLKKILSIGLIFLFFCAGFYLYKSIKNKICYNIFEFPKLTGPYGVGLTKRHLIDNNRKETHNPSVQRELMIDIWYPATADKNSLVVYQEDAIEDAKASLKNKGFSEQDLTILDKTYSHAVHDAEFLTKHVPYPLVLFSHGYLGCNPTIYTAFYEELASHGYIVVSIAHTYYANEVKFPDGRVIKPAPEKYSQQSMPSIEEEQLWTADIQFVLESLERYNTDSHNKFYNGFDFARVGIMGHSMGGLAAFELCLKDSRFKAGISLDALPFRYNIKMLHKPFMFILSKDLIQGLYESDAELAEKMKVDIDIIVQMRKANAIMIAGEKNNYEELSASKNISHLVIPNIKHMGFSDFLLLKELSIYKNNKNIFDLDSIIGSADGFETINLINKNIVNFFDKSLKK